MGVPLAAQPELLLQSAALPGGLPLLLRRTPSVRCPPQRDKRFFFLGGGGHAGRVWEGAAGALRHAPSTRNVVGVDVCYVLLRVWMVAVVCVCVRGGAAAYGSLCVATFLYGQAARPLP